MSFQSCTTIHAHDPPQLQLPKSAGLGSMCGLPPACILHAASCRWPILTCDLVVPRKVQPSWLASPTCGLALMCMPHDRWQAQRRG